MPVLSFQRFSLHVCLAFIPKTTLYFPIFFLVLCHLKALHAQGHQPCCWGWLILENNNFLEEHAFQMQSNHF